MIQDKYMPRERYMIAAILFFLLLVDVKLIIDIGVIDDKLAGAIGREALDQMSLAAEDRDIVVREEMDIKHLNNRIDGLTGMDAEMFKRKRYQQNVQTSGIQL